MGHRARHHHRRRHRGRQEPHEDAEDLGAVRFNRLEGAFFKGGVFWFDGERWHAAEGFLEHCEREGLDPMVESGFEYCLQAYRFGHDLTAPAE